MPTVAGRLLRLLAVCGCLPALTAQSPFARKYVQGERDVYEMGLRVGGEPGVLFGVSEHSTHAVGGAPFERVRWVSLSESQVGDLSRLLQDAGPFELSLAPGSSLRPSPAVGNPALQMLTDSLHMVYLAVSPAAGADRLREPGDAIVGEIYREDGFATGAVRAERWAAEPRLWLLGLDAKEAHIRAALLPPREASWRPLRPWMQSECSGGGPASFEAVEPAGDGFVVAWGCEQASALVALSAETGKILRAELDVRISYTRRRCADEALTDCEEDVRGMQSIFASLTLKPPEPKLPPDQLSENERDGLEYVLIPAGAFEMGCVPGDSECYERERPRHKVEITEPFWLGRTEVPVEAFERFVRATGRAMPPEPQGLPDYNDDWEKKSHPMVKVTWEEAQAYCTWAGGRLPTEAEWERAARGGVEGLKYPWGNERTHDEANYWRTGSRDGWKHTAPVASFPANGYGLYDMAGNVYEWTADWFAEDYFGRSPGRDPRGPASGKQRSVRGGAGFINPAVLRISTRLQHEPDGRNLNVGFRCALDERP